MRKIKVLEMIDRSSLGGGQAALLALAAHLDKERFEILISAKDGGPLAEETRRLGLRFLPVPFKKTFSPSMIREIRSILEGNEIDILHTHGGIAGLWGRWASVKRKTPIVVHTLHGIHYLHYRNKALRFLSIRLERHLSRRTDAVVFVSEADLKEGERHKLAPGMKRVLIKNGIDMTRFRETDISEKAKKDVKWRLNLDPPIVGTIARLHRQKGIIDLIRAAGQIHRGSPGTKIVVVGGGPLERTLRAEAQKLGLERFFVMLGERIDARELLSLFDIFALSSLWEGLPLALLEAAAMGKPIVATDIDGVREVIQDGETGLLVPPANPEKLAEAILRLLQDKNLARKLGENAKATIPASFPLSKMIEETEQLYLRLFQAATAC
jgi:glycosyltransferase involved in cell wall biosynthesis